MSLSLTDIRLTYADGDGRLIALDDVTLRVAPAEFLAITGPSGSGKSSLLAVAGALITPESGQVSIAGRNPTGLDPKARDRLRLEAIGFVFQQPNLLPSLTALDQLLLVADLRGTRGPAVRSRALELLDRVGLADRSHRRPAQLSGGERQRVNVARALMGEPAVLLVDEPTAALDHARGADIVGLLRDVTREHGTATVMVTHDLSQLHLVDHTVELRDGHLTEATRRV